MPARATACAPCSRSPKSFGVIVIAHGIDDTQMPIEMTARKYVPRLKSDGYDVTYHEYDGGHRVPPAEIREAFKWFVGRDPK